MPADGTVDYSIVKQSANGGKVDVDNGDAACIVPLTVVACTPALWLARVGGKIVLPIGAMIVLALLSFQARCCPSESAPCCAPGRHL